MIDDRFKTGSESEPSTHNDDPMNRPVTGKEVGATMLGVAWVGVSMYVASRNLIVGALMFAGFFVIGYVAFQRNIRSMSPDEQAKFAERFERYENSKLVRGMKFVKFLAFIYILYIVLRIVLESNAV